MYLIVKYLLPPKSTMFTNPFWTMAVLQIPGYCYSSCFLLHLVIILSLKPNTLLLCYQPKSFKIVTIMNLNKSDCDYFSEIRNLVEDFYKLSQTAFFDKYFCTQSLGLLPTPSQFLIKVCVDLEQLCPGRFNKKPLRSSGFTTTQTCNAETITLSVMFPCQQTTL